MPALSSPPFQPTSPTTENDVADALAELQRRLDGCQSGQPEIASLDALAEVTAAAARALMALPPRKSSSALAEQGLAVVRALRDSHLLETVAVLAGKRVIVPDDRGWPVLTARMLLSESWQSVGAPLLGGVPDWMWGDYARWLFSAPPRYLAPHEADVYAAHITRHLAELNRWMKRNAGSAAVRAAADTYLAVGRPVLLQRLSANVKKAASAHAEFLGTYFSAVKLRAPESPIVPRLGRRLRVGIVSHGFGPDADLRALKPLYAELDPRTFEVTLISLSSADVEFAAGTRGSARECIVMPPEIAERVANLRAMNLDIVVFGNAAGRIDEVTQLALHRVAPLQVAAAGGANTTGLPEMDVCVLAGSGDHRNFAEEFVERVGLLRGPAVSFAIPETSFEAGDEDPRTALGLPVDATLFVAVVTSSGVSLQAHDVWAKTLEACADSRLLIARVSDLGETDAAAGTGAFCNELGQSLEKYGVSMERVSVFPIASNAQHEVRTLLRLADVYLDAMDGSDPVWVAEALTLGRPVVAKQGEGAIAATGAAVLTSCGVSDLVVDHEAAYLEKAKQLATDVAARAAASERIKAAIAARRGFADVLARSDAFGALLETAFDELAALGRAEFRAQREPLRPFGATDLAETIAAGEAALAKNDTCLALSESELALRAAPDDVAARILRGRALLADGATARAVTYLLTATESRPDDAELWFNLAIALQRNQQWAEAVQALEISLRLDRSRVDGWLLLTEIAERAGAVEIAGEARTVLREIAPGDPRVVAMI